MNKLFCSFVENEKYLDKYVDDVKNKYDIINNKIFVLENIDEGGYIVTFSVDSFNLSNIPDNTIIVHRKKDYNTLYTINALNHVIKSHNFGVLDENYVIDWENYKNCILLIRKNDFYRINTKLNEIILIS